MEKLALAVVTAARKLRPYFQSHSIIVMTSQPLRTILHSPSQSGRLAKWAIELSEYDIEYRPRAAAKAQVLADFVIELASEHLDLETEAPKVEPIRRRSLIEARFRYRPKADLFSWRDHRTILQARIQRF